MKLKYKLLSFVIWIKRDLTPFSFEFGIVGYKSRANNKLQGEWQSQRGCPGVPITDL